MSNKVTFETDAFGTTKEVWLKASESLGLKKNNGTTQIKRSSPNQVQIINPKGNVIAKFSATIKRNKKIWTQN